MSKKIKMLNGEFYTDDYELISNRNKARALTRKYNTSTPTELTLRNDIQKEGLESLITYAKPVVIEDGVWIDGNSIILPGIKIGANSVIGAGSVVTKGIPANVVAVGNPCKVIKSINEKHVVIK